jgi:hypothetical protein
VVASLKQHYLLQPAAVVIAANTGCVLVTVTATETEDTQPLYCILEGHDAVDACRLES